MIISSLTDVLILPSAFKVFFIHKHAHDRNLLQVIGEFIETIIG